MFVCKSGTQISEEVLQKKKAAQNIRTVSRRCPQRAGITVLVVIVIVIVIVVIIINNDPPWRSGSALRCLRCCAIPAKEVVASNSPLTERASQASWRVTDGQGTAGRGQPGRDSREGTVGVRLARSLCQEDNEGRVWGTQGHRGQQRARKKVSVRAE